MLATFYGGPADGGELNVLEPIPRWLRFPMTPAEYEQHLGPAPASTTGPVPLEQPSLYRLVLVSDAQGRETCRVARDQTGRVQYRYVSHVSSTPTPTEGENHA